MYQLEITSFCLRVVSVRHLISFEVTPQINNNHNPGFLMFKRASTGELSGLCKTDFIAGRNGEIIKLYFAIIFPRCTENHEIRFA